MGKFGYGSKSRVRLPYAPQNFPQNFCIVVQAGKFFSADAYRKNRNYVSGMLFGGKSKSFFEDSTTSSSNFRVS